jgi:hypothetical protein
MKLGTILATVTANLLAQVAIAWVTIALDNLNASPLWLSTE